MLAFGLSVVSVIIFFYFGLWTLLGTHGEGVVARKDQEDLVTIVFQDDLGQSHTVLRNAAGLELGDTVPLLYAKRDPGEARVKESFLWWAVCPLLVIQGFLMAGLCNLIIRKLKEADAFSDYKASAGKDE